MVTIDSASKQAVLKIKTLNKLTREGVEHGAWISARGLRSATSKEILRKPKGGRVYIIKSASGRRRRHRASAPGETHANLSGALRRSLDFKVSFKEIDFGYGVTKNNAPEYAEDVEFGNSRMAPRPSLQNGIRSEQRNLQANFDREIGKRLGDKVII